MLYGVTYTKKFTKGFKKLLRSGSFNRLNLEKVIEMIASGIELPKKYRDHNLIGEWIGFRECHIEFDLLLIYKIESNTLVLVEIGTHPELFG